MKILSIFSSAFLLVPFLLGVIIKPVFAQSCLPDGITFSTQAEIDSFQINHPGCTHIMGPVVVEEKVIGNITSLNGLSGITIFGDDLKIIDNDSLPSLHGLDMVSMVEGNLYVGFNSSLPGMEGLDNLISIGGDLMLERNNTLSTLRGLGNLISIGEDLFLETNNSLSDFSGLSKISRINGNVLIRSNSILNSLKGLDNVAFINGFLSIRNNGSLKHLNNLNKLTFIGGDLGLNNNDSIVSLSGLDSLSYIGGALPIYNNDALISLEGLENVSSIEEYVAVRGNPSLVSLTGLNGVTTIGKFLTLGENTRLTSLNGLENLSYIGGFFYIGDNDALTQLDGLDKLVSIGGYLDVRNNASLNDLSSLNQLTSIDGDLNIINNASLSSLEGLGNIDYTSISKVTITVCPNLSLCAITSICDYLDSDGFSLISGNAIGCNEQSEIEAVCEIIPEANFSTDVSEGCAPLTVQFTDESTGFVEDWDWTFMGGTPVSSTEQNPLVTFNGHGTFEVTLVVSNDTLGRSRETTMIDVHENLPVSINISAQDTSICYGENVLFFADPTNEGDSPIYQWKVKGKDVGENQFYYAANFPENGDTVTCTLISSENCTQTNLVTSAPIVIEVFDLPQTDIEGDSTFCMNDSTVLTAIGGESYSWSTGETTDTIYALSGGDYTVTVTGDNGCTATAIRTVYEYPIPEVNCIGIIDTICNTSGEIDLLACQPNGGSYVGPGVNNNRFDPMIAGVGTHDLVYTFESDDGCINSDTSQIVVELCTNTDEIRSKRQIVVFPNPSTGQFSIQLENWDATVKIEITDILGHLIYIDKGITNNIQYLDLPRGIYLLSVSDAEVYSTKRIIVH